MYDNSNNNINKLSNVQSISDRLPKLSDQLKDDIIKFSEMVVGGSKKRRDELGLTKNIKEVVNAHNKKHNDDYIENLDESRSKLYLPWVYDAHLAMASNMTEMLIGGNGDFFQITGITEDDKINCERMNKVLSKLYNDNFQIRQVFKQAILQWVIKGNTVIKNLWHTVIVADSITSIDELGQEVQEIKKIPIFDNPTIEYVDFEDFHFFPDCVDFQEANKIHIKKIEKQKLLNLKDSYNNWSELENNIYDLYETDSTKNQTFEIWEVYIFNAFLDKQKISNCVVTIIDRKYIIDYSPNPYPNGICPFNFTSFNTIPGSLYGEGLCFGAVEFNKIGNFIINMLIDSIKIGVFPMNLIPDGIPYKHMISRPGGLVPWPIELAKLGIKPQPLTIDISKLPLTFETLLLVKKEFEKDTIPEFVSGMRPEMQGTATRDSLIKQGSDVKLTDLGKLFNNNILKPHVSFVYEMYSLMSSLRIEVKLKIAKICLERTKEEIVKLPYSNLPPLLQAFLSQPIIMQAAYALGFDLAQVFGEEKIQQVVKSDEELLAEFNTVVPLDCLDVKIQGFDTNFGKIKKLNSIRSLAEYLTDPNVLSLLDLELLLKDVLFNLDLDAQDLILSREERLKKAIEQLEDQMKIETERQMLMSSSGLSPTQPQVQAEGQQPIDQGGV